MGSIASMRSEEISPPPVSRNCLSLHLNSCVKVNKLIFSFRLTENKRPVSPDLIWDIEAELRPETDRGRIALTAKSLNQIYPLTDKIYFPLSGTSNQRKIKISSICNDLNEIGLLKDRTKNMRQNQYNPLTYHVDLPQRPERVARGFADFLGAVIQLDAAAPYQDTVILRPGGITLSLNIYEQLLIANIVHTQHDLYIKAYVSALEQIVGGRSAAASFVKSRLTSYTQRREIIAQVINIMRNSLSDLNFGQGVELETPLERRVAATERKLAELVADILEINTIADLKQRAPEDIWKRIQQRLPSSSDSQPLHLLFGLGEIRAIVERRNNRGVVMSKLTDSDIGFRNADEVMVAFSGISGFKKSTATRT